MPASHPASTGIRPPRPTAQARRRPQARAGTIGTRPWAAPRDGQGEHDVLSSYSGEVPGTPDSVSAAGGAAGHRPRLSPALALAAPASRRRVWSGGRSLRLAGQQHGPPGQSSPCGLARPRALRLPCQLDAGPRFRCIAAHRADLVHQDHGQPGGLVGAAAWRRGCRWPRGRRCRPAAAGPAPGPGPMPAGRDEVERHARGARLGAAAARAAAAHWQPAGTRASDRGPHVAQLGAGRRPARCAGVRQQATDLAHRGLAAAARWWSAHAGAPPGGW